MKKIIFFILIIATLSGCVIIKPHHHRYHNHFKRKATIGKYQPNILYRAPSRVYKRRGF